MLGHAKTYGIVYLETNTLLHPSMESYLNNFLADPMFYIGGFFSAIAVFAFLIFFRGFLPGVAQLFTFSGNDEHLRHAYTRVIWGTYLLVLIFATWEVLRLVASWFGYGTASPGLAWSIIAVAVVALAWSKIRASLKGKNGH